jgi:hypothetical protein
MNHNDAVGELFVVLSRIAGMLLMNEVARMTGGAPEFGVEALRKIGIEYSEAVLQVFPNELHGKEHNPCDN